ncbi:hypothetical protein [Novosphingobium sp. Gsoil 351]|uniref:hypothetical protein n=1 Tax=Novosphingobium sp. Gsoil 351 TaxID=2675225 RepID=UPI0012B4F40C|nr:hypothetical protein [Novosphingobium sp. Gsoil 351]QGN55933.1 hypothetical protein GKE62_16610 [Novosphingobium sp. Gsoil 351]
MKVVTIDGMDEQEFRHSIEDMLRHDQVDEAATRLRALLEPCTGVHETLPPRFLEVTSRDIEVGGWHRLADRLLDHDRPNHKISAIGVTLADARVLGGPGPSRGRLAPFIKTFYFNDDAYPFSDATRDDLLDGYSRDGFEWQGDYQATDATLSIRGIDDLYGAIVELEDRLLDSADPDEGEIRAGSIGACYLATLIHQSLRDTIRAKGLPRPLCVLAACDGVYPFFDAPVAGTDACAATEPADETIAGSDEATSAPDEDEGAEVSAGMASLLSLVSQTRTKAPVMVLCDEDVEEAFRYTERAEAERVGIEDGHALNLALAESQAALLAQARAEAALVAGELDWDETGRFDQDISFLDRTDVDNRAQFLPVIEVPSPPARDEEYHFETVDTGQPDDEYLNGDDDDGLMGPDTFSALDEERAFEEFVTPASHSLRARINLRSPEDDHARPGLFAAPLAWLKRLIFKR